MLIRYCLLLGLLVQQVNLVAQKIQYSRQTFPHSFADETQLVTDVDGYHHLLRFRLDSKPAVHIFNAKLEYKGKVDIDISVKGAFDIRVVPLLRSYLLYFHEPGNLEHNVFRISGDGNVLNETAALQKLMDTLIPKSKATYQFLRRNNQLALLTHTYFDAIKKVCTTIAALDDQWNSVEVNKVFFPLDKEKETLRQVLLTKDHLAVLKTGIEQEKGSTLEVIKTNLHTGELFRNTFTAASHLYNNAGMQYLPKDSSLLVHAVLRESLNSSRQQRATFISRMDHQLHELKPVTLYKLQPRRNVVVGFLMVNCEKPFWVLPISQVVLRRSFNRQSEFGVNGFDAQTFRLFENDNRYTDNRIGYNQPTAVSFTVLDANDKKVADTVVENNGSFYDVQPRPYAQFSLGNKACLLFQQNFSAKQKGLVLFHAAAAGKLVSTPLPVFDRHEYFVPQTQAGKDYFILPYRDGKEIGLVKITLANEEK